MIALFVAAASAARLENTYLPPSGAAGAGGSGSFLSTPFQQAGGASSFGAKSSGFGAGPSSFGKPSGFGGAPAAPSPAYGAPAGGAGGAGGAFGGFGGGAAGRGSFGPTSPPIAILKFNNENNGDGTYRFESVERALPSFVQYIRSFSDTRRRTALASRNLDS